MRRSAVSVAANIVEGCGRESRLDFLRFLGMSFGSARELGYYIGLANRLGYISEDQFASTDNAHRRTAAALAALIRSIKVLRP